MITLQGILISAPLTCFRGGLTLETLGGHKINPWRLAQRKTKASKGVQGSLGGFILAALLVTGNHN
jgi:hypothetical protein